MPYLRYSRDKRGYEHTYVLHGSRAGGRPRILYWFRTPPHVVVGRNALDEDATKAIEVSNPDLDFDWSKMRRERPKPPSRLPAVSERMQKGNRRPDPARVKAVKAPTEVSAEKSPVVDVDAKNTSEVVLEASPGPSVEVASPDSEMITSSPQPSEHPVSALLGDQMLGKLRSMYSDLEEQLQAAKIAESVKNELRIRIAALNPDSWLAGEEVIRRIEQFESEVAAIQVHLTDS